MSMRRKAQCANIVYASLVRRFVQMDANGWSCPGRKQLRERPNACYLTLRAKDIARLIRVLIDQ
jgi:hypothetical protein